MGRAGEDAARAYFIRQGAEILERNWRCRIGEIDLVVLDRGVLVVVEVKSRRDSRLSREHLFDTIGARKQHRLRQLAELFVRRNPRYRGLPLRLDAIGVLFTGDDLSRFEIRHIVSAL
ncbi:MAG: YraN family protein [Bdellovibrionales bacterium]|nr:YraN family protein [Bdellovibrionales bacterium]